MGSTNRTALSFAGVLALCVFSGCETETIKHVRVMDALGESSGPEVTRVTREQKLRERVEKDSKDVQGWFELGEYYENGMNLIEAVNCYEKGNSLLDRGRYTGGYYLLARVYMRLQEW